MGLKDITGWGQAGYLIGDEDVSENANIQRSKLGTRTAYILIPATSLAAAGTGCVPGNTNVYGHVVMPDANSSSLTGAIPLPDDYDSGDITARIFWLTAATAGDVKFSLAHACRAAGEALTAEATGTVTDTAKGTTLLINNCTITLAEATITDGKILGFVLSRDPSDGSDTLSADARILAIRFEYTARG
jgi:hypothetical protein